MKLERDAGHGLDSTGGTGEQPVTSERELLHQVAHTRMGSATGNALSALMSGSGDSVETFGEVARRQHIHLPTSAYFEWLWLPRIGPSTA